MEVNNQKIIEKYQQVLATRSHDVLVMTLAIEQLEAENLELKRKVAEFELKERNYHIAQKEAHPPMSKEEAQ